MGMLTKNDALFERDDKGNLFPIEVELFSLAKDGEVPKIKIIPISRGKWRHILSLKDDEQDLIILKEHIVEPKFTEEDYKAIKPHMMKAIIDAVTAVTLDIDISSVIRKTKEKATADEEEYIQKK